MDLDAIRHSAAHVLADAVKSFYPKAKPTIGPVIENGFYYDIYNLKLEEKDLPKIEKKMQEIINKNLKFQQVKLSRKQAEKFYKDNKFKREILKDIKGTTINFYKHGEFLDLCKGNHARYTSDIKAINLLKISGAYWRGDSKKEQLTRIYGTAFSSKKDLDDYLKLLKEAEKRDHKKIGEALNLYMISEDIGKGLPIWLPKGETIKREIEKFAIETEDKAGYLRVSTPHIAKEKLFITSGHLPYYKDSMYPSMKMDDGNYYLKAMNCPLHHVIFNHGLKSYRDLPVRLAEYGLVYRNELSGTLSGLLRVIMLSMNDAHIYCIKEQIDKEVESVLQMIINYYNIFGLNNYYFRLSLWDQKNKSKYINEPKNWKYSEEELRKVLKRLKINYTEARDEATFYGPKIDIQFKTALGREETLSTIQLDFAAKSRFKLKYFDKNGKVNNEVFVIHRAPLSTHERFIAFLIEHYAGRFPLWLSPIQVILLTINNKCDNFALEILEKLKEKNIRVELDNRVESIPKKVHDAEILKIPLIVTIGEKEVANKTLAIRDQNGKVRFGIKIDDFINNLLEDIKNKKL